MQEAWRCCEHEGSKSKRKKAIRPHLFPASQEQRREIPPKLLMVRVEISVDISPTLLESVSRSQRSQQQSR